MSKKNYKKTALERQQHDTAVKVRKMTDEQLCNFLDEIVNANKREAVNEFIVNIDVSKIVGRMTINKIRRFFESQEE